MWPEPGHRAFCSHGREQETAAEPGAPAPDWRERLADERERKADDVEAIADERERRAEERETTADEREFKADERERLADVRDSGPITGRSAWMSWDRPLLIGGAPGSRPSSARGC